MVLEKQVPAPDKQLFERIAVGKNLWLINQARLCDSFNSLIFLIQGLPTVLYPDFLDGIKSQFLNVKTAMSRVTSRTLPRMRFGIFLKTSMTELACVPLTIATNEPLRPLAALLVTIVYSSPFESEVSSMLK
ncbi:hypothetical protein J2Y45_006560 [Dyadobacter sp. BE34]|uniref:Uncharacterized protein n=1 Tax=Dyadobacter fermentans TaxID=94254 RepID=A0ABU1R867_9BACT|nr:hypothetical protein [Dyadobacter fermentans]MDR7047160.1 hypothetical protein [Dyadobacter sp. BE242]MDR7201396.1 hypothetical protein [Dyadobacter sp. BE34]MDR7219266.1 hypothetical protein [Dyadobacter sp. BE31]MDR7267032.1 hypothetical protein [Dyadobacter sp. BE32]